MSTRVGSKRALASVLVAAGAMSVACWFTFGSREVGVPIDTSAPQGASSQEVRPPAGELASEPVPRLESTLDVPQMRVESAVAADEAQPTGALRLAFVSALDGSPVAGIGFVAFRERGGYRELARGVSDADGRAERAEIEENVILVESARQPPFARKVAATWLAAATRQELTIELDAGAHVTGRVVDDEAKPVAGAEILVEGDVGGRHARDFEQHQLARAAATTGEDGRFAVDHVSNAPYGVWFVEGEMRPERWDAASLWVRHRGQIQHFAAHVARGGTKDVGDVVLARSATSRLRSRCGWSTCRWRARELARRTHACTQARIERRCEAQSVAHRPGATRLPRARG